MKILLTLLGMFLLLAASCRSNKETVCPPVVIPTDCDAFRQQLRAIDEQYVFDSLIINGGDSSYILDSLGVRGMPLKTKDFDGPGMNKTYEGCPYFVQFAPYTTYTYDVSPDTTVKTYIEFNTLIEGNECTLKRALTIKAKCYESQKYPNCVGKILYAIYAIRTGSNYYRVQFTPSKVRFISKPGPDLSTFVFRKR